MPLSDWCAQHSFKEFLELLEEGTKAKDHKRPVKTGWDAFADAVKSEDSDGK